MSHEFTELVKLASLDPECQYCQQFRNIFELDKHLNGLVHFTLCRGKSLFGEKSWPEPFSYLEIQLGVYDTRPYIYFFPLEVTWLSTVYPVGMYIKSSLPDFDDFKTVLHNCCANHISTCTLSPPDLSLLQLIDCKNRRIIPAPLDQRYICLSYVWGYQADGLPTFHRSLLDTVPKTVEDAMFVAIQLGIPFL